MLYMGSVNRTLFWVIIPLILFLYISIRIFEWQSFDDGNRLSIANEHYQNTKVEKKINCLILGGSNAVFSLSAEQMSRRDELNCYNLSLINEGFSFPAYWNFIESLSLDRNKINYIFYSSMVSELDEDYYFEKLNNAKLAIGISGKNSLSFSGKSLASYIFDLIKYGEFKSSIQFPLPTSYGDFDFTKFTCKFNNTEERRNWQDLNLLADWVISQLHEMRVLFPNAHIFFIRPALLRGEGFNKEVNNVTNKALESLFLNSGISFVDTIFLAQKQFYDSIYMCDSNHHTNSTGREIRTNNLLNGFEKFKQE